MHSKGLTLVLLSAVALTGCIYVNDAEDERGERRYRSRSEPTIGQELIDLDRARASGVITTAEYENAKEIILDDIN